MYCKTICEKSFLDAAIGLGDFEKKNKSLEMDHSLAFRTDSIFRSNVVNRWVYSPPPPPPLPPPLIESMDRIFPKCYSCSKTSEESVQRVISVVALVFGAFLMYIGAGISNPFVIGAGGVLFAGGCIGVLIFR